MTVALTPDTIELFNRGEELDDHGWHLPASDEPAAWEGRGNLQLNMGNSVPRMDGGGGRGPFGPAYDLMGQLYLPTVAHPEEGQVARIRGRYFVLSNVRWISDPVDSGWDCYVAQVSSVDTWPGENVG